MRLQARLAPETARNDTCGNAHAIGVCSCELPCADRVAVPQTLALRPTVAVVHVFIHHAERLPLVTAPIALVQLPFHAIPGLAGFLKHVDALVGEGCSSGPFVFPLLTALAAEEDGNT
jgi:hypothetical protein